MILDPFIFFNTPVFPSCLSAKPFIYALFFSWVVLFCLAISCQKDALLLTHSETTGSDPTTASFDLATATHQQLQERTMNPITYSQRGRYAPFGQGSTWQYRTIAEDRYYHTNQIARSDTTYETVTTGDTVILDHKEYIELGTDLIHIANGIYYKRSAAGTDVQYMVENPTVGMTWGNSEITAIGTYTLPYNQTSRTYQNVVVVREGTVVPIFKFYAPNVGYLGRQLSYFGSWISSVDQHLMSYTVQPY